TMDLAQMTAMATADGSFEFRAVQPGRYLLLGIRTQGRVQTLGRMPIEVTSSGLDGLVFPLSEGFDLAGMVRVEGERNRIPPGLILPLLPAEGPTAVPLSAAVNESGAFHFSGVLRDSYRLNFSRLPEGTYVRSMRVSGQEALDKGLDLTQATSAPAVE